MKPLKETICEDLGFYTQKFLDSLKEERGFSNHTVTNQRVSLGFFLKWAFSLGLYFIHQITKENISDFEIYLFNYQKPDSETLTFLTQRQRVSAVRSFFSWLLSQGFILVNPAADIEFPKKTKSLPRFILTEKEAKAVLNQPDISNIYGLRDRAILEVFYSCGLRRAELINLCTYDVDFNRETLSVRKGKGQKNRIVPLGQRVLFWLKTYLEKSRPALLGLRQQARLFIIKGGLAMKYHHPGVIVRESMVESGITRRAGCHIFRHTMATHMLNNGAGIRYVQQMLGHAMLSTTQIYTRVAIDKLKEVHEKSFGYAYQKPDIKLPPVKGKTQKSNKKETKRNTTGNLLRFSNEKQRLINRYFDYLKMKNYSIKTIDNRRSNLNRFSQWLGEQKIYSFKEIDRKILQNYQSYAASFTVDGRTLSAPSRFYMLSHVAGFFSWLSKNNHILINPAAGLSMPKVVKSLPVDVLSIEEVEAIFSQVDLKSPEGLRDRAALELFYSSGIRLSELCHLKISDIDFENLTLFICQGKGKKDRYVPVGLRALFWVQEYINRARVYFQQKETEDLFLNRFGDRYGRGLGARLKEYMKSAGIQKSGSTILFRHSMATQMMDNDADLRYIQSILGHESIETTKIYTHVSIDKLRAVHSRTHPAEKPFR